MRYRAQCGVGYLFRTQRHIGLVNFLVPFVVASACYLSGRRRVLLPATIDTMDWQPYLADFHDRRPAITERLLAHADSSPYAWLVEPLRPRGPILDLASGSAPTRDHLRTARWIGLDSSPGELTHATYAGRGPLVRGHADALPLADRSVDAVCAAMCLPIVTPLDDVLAELRRVMRPGATLVALVPSQPGASLTGWLRWLRVMRTLGIRDQPWPNPRARDGLPKLLRNAGMVIDSSERRMFSLDMSSPAAIELLVDSLYLPGVDETRIAQAKARLAARASPGHRMPLPLRRVVAHVPS